MLFSDILEDKKSFATVKTTYVDNNLHYEEIELPTMDLNNKCIIVLCGNDTRDPLKAGNYARHNFNWLNDYPDKENISIYSIYYPTTQPLNNDFTLNPFFNYDELSSVIKDKLFYKNNQILSTDEIINNLSNITFLGHSIGGQVMNELVYSIINTLTKENFSHLDIIKICKNIVFVGYAPYEFVDEPISSIYITPLHDSVDSSKLAFDRMFKHKNITFSNPSIDTDFIKENITSFHDEFVNAYRNATNNEDFLLAKYQNSLVVIPELLFFNPYDGIMEDHNLAGVVHYSQEHPYKTSAGRNTTTLLDYLLTYSLSTNRENFSINEIYNHALTQFTSTSIETHKEL